MKATRSKVRLTFILIEEQSTFQPTLGQGIMSLFCLRILERPMAKFLLEEDPPLVANML